MHNQDRPWQNESVVSRRGVLIAPVVGVACVAAGSRVVATLAPPGQTEAAGSSFPRLDPKLVAAVVGKSHFDENGVQELVKAHPALVNAWWDWGFGDWESPLGAASHTGRRSIAEFLIERGARIDIFAAAMLGYTDVVRAFIAARPGVQRTLGPHCIPLLAHAKVGGEKAKDTHDYLKSLGDAGNGPEIQPIEDAAKKRHVGVYSFGAGKDEQIEITLDDKGFLLFQKSGDASRIRIHSLGNGVFFPAGVATTKLVFDLEKSPATLTIPGDPSPLIAIRTVAP